MLKIKNVSPLGDLDVPLLGRVVKAGEVVEVTKEQSSKLLAQGDVWEPASSKDAGTTKVAVATDNQGEKP